MALEIVTGRFTGAPRSFQMTKEIIIILEQTRMQTHVLVIKYLIYHAENYVLGSLEQQQRYTKEICIIFGDDRIQ
jgi:hypothetical protein